MMEGFASWGSGVHALQVEWAGGRASSRGLRATVRALELFGTQEGETLHRQGQAIFDLFTAGSGINDLGRRRRKKREEAPALVDRAARLVGVLLMLMLMLVLELELVLVLQIHKLAAGALGWREKIKDRGMEAPLSAPPRDALFCLYLV
jgi:hypothetical protein